MADAAGTARQHTVPAATTGAAMDDDTAMALRADVDFTYDARGRMLASNEPCVTARSPAPRLFLGYTKAGCVTRFGSAVPDALARRLAEIVASRPLGGDSRVPPAMDDALRAALATQAPVIETGGGPAYRFPAEFNRPDEVVRLTMANRMLARQTYAWLWTGQPCFAVVRDDAAVAICFSARLGPHAAEAGVETQPSFRGRGYAAAVTAAWAADMWASGRVPLYSTAWDNLASQGVARRLGLFQIGADAGWT